LVSGPNSRSQRSGLALAVTGFALLSCGDSVVKSMAGDWPGTALAATRFAMGAVGLGAILLWRHGIAGFAVPRMGVQVLRGLLLAVASLLFFLSIHLMPLAEATAISFATPAIIALLSALLLGERIPRLSWLAMVFASIGVVAVLRPNVAILGWVAVMPLVAALSMAGFFMLNRASVGDVPPLAAQFWVAAWATPFQIAVAVAGDTSSVAALAVSWPEWTVIFRCAIVATCASFAHYLVFLGTVRASAATIAPASYVQIIIALMVGMLFFDDWPDAVGIIGTASIIVAGLMLWHSSKARVGEKETLA
jgi:drug/metabolite transporter (DMT)-like permease